MSELRPELRYASTHEWIRLDSDGTAWVGITDHAQEALGDLVYVELPTVGERVDLGGEAGVVESVKAASDIYAPASGEILAVNEALEENPEQVNQDPYGDGWLFRMRLDDPSELEDLLSADQYAAQVEAEG